MRDYTICYEYDAKNNLVKEYCPADGDYIEYTYNKGNVTYIYKFNFITEGVILVEETFFEYDALGNMLLKEEREENKLERKITWEYDEYGTLTKEINYTGYSDHTQIDLCCDYEYDSNGVAVKRINYEMFSDTETNGWTDIEYIVIPEE